MNIKKNILALDVATKTGWAVKGASGIWDFKLQRDESSGMRIIRFRAKLREIVAVENIDLIVFERTAGAFKGALIVQSELHGVLKLFCEDNKIDYRSYSAKEMKALAGYGNASKKFMIDTAIVRHAPNLIIDDNHADALWLYWLTDERLNSH